MIRLSRISRSNLELPDVSIVKSESELPDVSIVKSESLQKEFGP